MRLSNEALERAFRTFSGSDMQGHLHEFLRREIEDRRTALEVCADFELVTRHQENIACCRRLLSEIHSRDSVDVRNAYAKNNL